MRAVFSHICSFGKKKIWQYRREAYLRNERCRLQRNGFTLISQNCIGGMMYHALEMEFLSPTINTLIKGENFIYLLENISQLDSLKVEAIRRGESSCPTIKVGDAIISCPHSTDSVSAALDWSRRVRRIDADNIFVIANTWDLNERQDLIDKIQCLPYKKIIFTCNPVWRNTDLLYLNPEYYSLGNGPNYNLVLPFSLSGRRVYEDAFDWINWLNE